MYEPSDAEKSDLVYQDHRWHPESTPITPDATNSEYVDVAYADVQVEFQYEADGVTPRYAIEHDGQKLDIDYDPLNPPSRVEDIVDSNGDQVFAHKWTSGENLLADSVIGTVPGKTLNVWYLENSDGSYTFAVRDENNDPDSQVEIYDANGAEFSTSNLPHATEDLYDAGGAQLTPIQWEEHQLLDDVQTYKTMDSIGNESVSIDESGNKVIVTDYIGGAKLFEVTAKEDLFYETGAAPTASDQVVDFSEISEAAISDGYDDGITSKQYRSDPDGDLSQKDTYYYAEGVQISSFDDNLNDISSAQTKQDLFANDGSGITADDQIFDFHVNNEAALPDGYEGITSQEYRSDAFNLGARDTYYYAEGVQISSFDDNLNDISSAQTRQDLFANDGSGITSDDQLIDFRIHLVKLSVISRELLSKNIELMMMI